MRPGQIAHLNRDPTDSRFENLVWLCLEHHDVYDSKTSQSKGFTIGEVTEYRRRLYDYLGTISLGSEISSKTAEPENTQDIVANDTLSLNAWRYPLWQVANQPDLFAFKARNSSDGICLIERIDLPDGRIVIACIEVAGNPGQSITNTAETICSQVCTRFAIPAARLVWLEHYDYGGFDEWELVTFRRVPPEDEFGDPFWTPITPEMWGDLRLKPRRRLARYRGSYRSKLTKLFDWPTRGLAPPD